MGVILLIAGVVVVVIFMVGFAIGYAVFEKSALRGVAAFLSGIATLALVAGMIYAGCSR